jgi:hypothetical protein
MLSALGNGVKGGKWYALIDKVYALGALRVARAGRHFCLRDLPTPSAETVNDAPARANVAQIRGFFQRPQETGFVRDCVVGLVGLEPATNRL